MYKAITVVTPHTVLLPFCIMPYVRWPDKHSCYNRIMPYVWLPYTQCCYNVKCQTYTLCCYIVRRHRSDDLSHSAATSCSTVRAMTFIHSVVILYNDIREVTFFHTVQQWRIKSFVWWSHTQSATTHNAIRAMKHWASIENHAIGLHYTQYCYTV